MIAFGVCVSSRERFDAFAKPGIIRCAGSEPLVIERHGQDSIYAAYNSILDAAASIRRLEALVLLHDDTEIRDPRLSALLRAAFADPSVGVVGAVGGRGVRRLAWWEADRYGGFSYAGMTAEEGPRVERYSSGTTWVDSVDGYFMALSPWVVRHVRFDARRFTGFHGYDVDFCFEVRARGRQVVVTDLDIHHHNHKLGYFPGRLEFRRNDIRWRAKWGFSSPAIAPLRLAGVALESKAASARRHARAAFPQRWLDRPA
jgi:GT2 family glycosyltransferase